MFASLSCTPAMSGTGGGHRVASAALPVADAAAAGQALRYKAGLPGHICADMFNGVSICQSASSAARAI